MKVLSMQDSQRLKVAVLVRKTIIVSVIGVSLLAVGCSGKATQQGNPSTAVTTAKQSESTGTAGSKSQAKIAPYKGVVDTVDTEKKTMAVLKGNAGMAIRFDVSGAKLVGYKKLGDIEPGDTVSIEYKVERGFAYAKTITKK